jgi:hypothetical protein
MKGGHNGMLLVMPPMMRLWTLMTGPPLSGLKWLPRLPTWRLMIEHVETA